MRTPLCVIPSVALRVGLALLLCVGLVSGQSLADGAVPQDWVGEGPLHSLLVDSGDTLAITRIETSGGVRFEHDYGAMRLYVVDEAAFGGAEGLAGLPVRDEFRLLPANGYLIDTSRPELVLDRLPASERMADLAPGVPAHEAGLYLVQLAGPPADAWLERLAATGARVVQFMPMAGYLVSASEQSLAGVVELVSSDPAFTWVGAWQPAFRMTPTVRDLAATAGGSGGAVAVRVQLVDNGPTRATLAALEQVGVVHGARRVGPFINVDVDLDPGLLRALAHQPAVIAIEPRGQRVRNDERQGQISAGNVSGSTASGPGYLSWLATKGFGSGQFGSFSVNVVDDAYFLTGHPDLPGSRIDFSLNPTGQSGTVGGHGFLNAHIVAGFNNGTGSANEDTAGYNYGLGIAPWAHVGSTAIFGSGSLNPSSYESDAYNNGARISTNSWSFESGGSPIPDYDSWSQEYDTLVRDARSSQGGNQEYMIVFSSGNDGPGSNSVSTPSTAKNILTVGASENWRPTGSDGCGVSNSGADDIRDLISFSSQGPVDSSGGDGRWKPEIVAQGTHVQAGIPQSSYDGSSVCNQYFPGGQTLYGWSSGTSHSTPGVAGGAALVRQWFLNNSMAAPSPALNKAVLVNSATYLTDAFAGDTLPSNGQGMGRMDLGRAFDGTARMFVDQSVVLGSTGATHQETGVVSDSGQPFRVTLVWTDAPGSTSGAPWVNDLDLTVNVGGATYRGNVFSGSTSVTGGSADFRNNTESVFLPSGLTGAFTVTVTASSIAGDGVPGNGDGTDQDFALVIHNGSTGGGPLPPVAGFVGNPVSGVVPLNVDFTDSSTGTVSTWSWTFGDGGTSTAQNPSHTYTAIGTYTVTLDVTGPAGADGETKVAYIDVTAAPPPGIDDGSFELQSAGATPTTPWSVDFGSGHVISPSGVSSDSGLPSDGTQWAELAADSTNNSTPPSNPGGTTSPASGGAGISQDFSYSAGVTELSFEALFLRNEDPDSIYNDWMSVDISDGSTTENLFFRDTFSATSGTSSKYGYAVTPLATVTVDLATLFPSSTTSTQFTITAQVGNGTDDFQPSKGYVDDFRLASTGPAAPVAEFSGTPTSGTVPLDVDFSDLSSGSVTSWLWTFGDGGTSTAQDPSHTYTSTGTYTVTLTATGPGGTDGETKTGYITVSEPAPTAGFSGTPTSGNSPLEVDFTDQSSGTITLFVWTFGDGGSSNAQDPSHTYTAAGTYDVTLTVFGPGGSDGETKTGYITVNEPAPTAEFSGTPTSGTHPLNVSFSDLSGGAVTSWSWTFGDGGTSSAQNPNHTYTAAGTYTVGLTVTGPGGSDLETKVAYVSVSEPAPVAEFSGTPVSGTHPLDVDFTDLSSGGPVTSWLWTFGDGGTSTAQDPSHTYTAAGTYTVTLTATGPGGSDGETKSGYISVSEPAPVADFSGTPVSGTHPLNVDFTDLSSGGPVTSWLWTFGDGGTSTVQDPSHTYTAAGTYTVTLTATGSGGSDGETKSGYISVSESAPVAGFSGTPVSGTHPLDVDFTDLSSGGPVTSWLWTFGDGGSSTAQNPSHTYTAAGTYTVTLTATGPGGSDGETKSGYISVSESAPVAGFSGTPVSGIHPLNVDFTDLSSGGPVTSWLWTFGDGGTSTAQDPSHTYTAAGTYTVTLTATGPGGSDGETKSGYINVSEPAPVAEFSGTPVSGTHPLDVDFTDLSSGGPITSWLWTFGDGGTSTAQNPSHTYTATGSYTVMLTATGPGGSDGETKSGYISVGDPAPTAEFSGAPVSGTHPLDVDFLDLSGGLVTSWSWTFGDGGSSTAQNPSHTYTAAGTYTVALTATGPGGNDTETKLGYVSVGEPAPVAEFSGTPTSGVLPLDVDFTDLSNGGPVTSWSWTFGDGGSSTAQHPSHTYTAAGSYEVTLTATGPGGSDAETKTGYVTVSDPAPVASFSVDPAYGAIPLPVSFTDSSSGPITSWAWNFGGGGSSNAQNPDHTYTALGSYTVTLTVTGPGGVDVATQVDVVEVLPNLLLDAGGGLAGSLGQPLLEGWGSLTGGDPVSLTLTNALPNGTAHLIIGFSEINLPFKGGTLVPAPDILLLGIPVDGAGSIVLEDTWPAGIPGGTVTSWQYWIEDGTGPQGFTASNGVSGTTP
jgi:PKD repeat protein